MKRILIMTGLLIVLAGIAAWWVRDQYHDFLESPLTLPEGGYVLMIVPGAPAGAIVQELSRQGFTRSGWQWRVLMRLERPSIRSGEYRLDPGLRPRELLKLLSSGEVVQYRFTLVPGWTFAQMLDALDRDQVLLHTLDDIETGAWPDVLPDIDFEHPEGWFLPETYQFTRGDTDVDLLRRSHRAMQRMLEQAWLARDDNLPLDSPYELLILASIIEKETAVETERAEIAGVFIRRLRKGMRLQTDPTVIYGMGDSYDGDIRRKDLKADTPYNTYTRSGLPPTPIALPGRPSLMAAGRPRDGNSLYFVSDGKGAHTFSATLEEHQKAVNKLIGKD